MALQLPIQYEQLVELVEQLSEEQQKDLIKRLLTRQAQQRPSKSLRVFHVEHFPENMTVRREDEYKDDE